MMMKTRWFYLIATIMLFTSLAVHAGITGNIRGVVTDAQTKENLAGVTVVATSPVLQGEEATLTDEEGRYQLTNLPAGTYKVTALFAGAQTEQAGIVVSVDKTMTINLKISMDMANGEVYVINEKAPNLDVATSTVGITMTKDYIENVPLGKSRNFEQGMNSLASSSGDAYGKSVGGATSPENAYVVDGMNAGDPSKGLAGTRLVLEFIDEFEIKEGGYGPEFGRATGGLINAVTKSGSNEFHGSIFGYYTPGIFQLEPKTVRRREDVLARKSVLKENSTIGVELGGPIVKDKLWFHMGFSREELRNNWVRTIYPVIEEDGKPKKDEFGQLVTSDQGVSSTYPALSTAYQYTLKLTHLIDNNNRHSVAVRGSPVLFEGAVTNPLDADSPGQSLSSEPRLLSFRQTSGNLFSAIYNYAGKFFNDKLRVDGAVGAHHQRSFWEPMDESTAKYPRVTYYNYTGGLEDLGESIYGCGKMADADASTRCPVRNYSKFGFGGLGDHSLWRIAEKLSFTNIFELGGLHQLKYGIDFEQLRSDLTRSYSGGVAYSDYGPKGNIRSQEYLFGGEVIRPDHPDERYRSIFARTGTDNYAVFLGDSYNPIPSLTFNIGVRWEAQNLMGIKSFDTPRELESKFAILDNWAPRVGGVWDFLGNGRSRLYAHFGRYYESIPMGLNERAFGGEGLRVKTLARSKCEETGALTADQIKACFAKHEQDVKEQNLGGEDSIVAPGLKGQYSDEFVAGLDIEPVSSWVVGVMGTYRNLGDIIEDVSTDGGETYVFANPSKFDDRDLQPLIEELARETDPAKRAALEKKIKILPGIRDFDKAVRKYLSVQFKLDKKLSENFMLLATYSLSWTFGNYPGLFSANNGQLDPNVTSQWDLPQLTVNRYGYLPQDSRHKFKLSGFYKQSVKEWGSNMPITLTLGTSAYVQSGTPYEVLGSDDIYGNDEVFLLPRGSGGRLPWTWGADLNLGATYEFVDKTSVELFVSLYNVTNNQQVVAVDDTYTYDTVRPIQGGDASQLAFAKNIQGKPITRNPNYGRPLAYQMPFSAQVGFRVKF